MDSSIIYENVLPTKICEKNYLNAETADVFFQFKVGHIQLPAHKNVLSAISTVFNEMFIDSNDRKGIVEIVDSTPDAFKEFLQFFYLSRVNLSSFNAFDVMKLGRKFAVKNCLDACSKFCKLTLTLDTICWGYELAILFELHDLKAFCEQKICENPAKTFRSVSFLMCDQNLLLQILQLNSLKCDETIVFDGCLAWARDACIQNKLDEQNGKNLRQQLAELIYEIRFNEMNIEDFYDRYCMYPGLFSVEEFEDIINMIALKQFGTGKFNEKPRKQRLMQKNNKLFT